MRTAASQPRDLLDHLLDPTRHDHSNRSPTFHPRVLLGDPDPDLTGQRIVGANHTANAVLQGSHQPAPIGVVLGIGTENHAQIQLQPDGKPADLHITFLEDVEQTHLNLGAQVRKLVHAEDAAMASGHQSEVKNVLTGEMLPLGVLDQVDLADQIGNRHVRCGQLLVVAVLPPDPLHRTPVSLCRHPLTGEL